MAGEEQVRRQREGRAQGRRRPPRARRRLRLVWVAALLALSVYLYYRPLASYFQTRGDLATQQATLTSLRLQKADLERQLQNATSVEAIQRAARRIGYVRPGEQLFIVKGIPDWRRAQRTLRRHG